MASYSLAETARILHISPARLRYWQRTELVHASARGDGAAGFAFRDLVRLRTVVSLLEGGVPLRRIRRSVARLRERMPELEEPLGALRSSPLGPGRLVVRLADVLAEPDGQLVLEFPGDGAGDAVRPLPCAAPAGVSEAPSSAMGWFELGCALDSDPQTAAEAARAYRRALALEPDFADAHCNLGTVHYNLGEREQARSAYEAALELDPGHLEANFNLGNLLEEDGRRELALRHYKRAIRTDPFFAEAHLNLALLYEKLRLSRSARAHWRRYLQITPDGSWADVARDRLEPEG